MRIAVYGGSFNPPHVAHAMVAAWLNWTDQVDEVWLVPVYRHAFEGQHGKTLAPYDLRCQWCQAMADDLGENVKVSMVESALPVPSYSIDTLRHLRQEAPKHNYRLVIGADVVPQLPDWKEWGAIAAEFSPVIVGRAGFELPRGVESAVFPGVSSTEIRARLAAGLPVAHLLTRGVAALVRSHYSAGSTM